MSAASRPLASFVVFGRSPRVGVLGSFDAETAAAAIEAAIRSAGYASLEDMRRAFGWNVELEADPGRPACGSCARLTAAALDLAEWARAVRPALGATSRLEMEARVLAVHEAVVAVEPDSDAPAAAGELAEAARLDAEADEEFERAEFRNSMENDFCEVCEEGPAEWVAPIGGGGGVRACSACVECHAADRMEPGVTWTRLDGRAKQTDGLVVLVNGADAARKEG